MPFPQTHGNRVAWTPYPSSQDLPALSRNPRTFSTALCSQSPVVSSQSSRPTVSEDWTPSFTSTSLQQASENWGSQELWDHQLPPLPLPPLPLPPLPQTSQQYGVLPPPPSSAMGVLGSASCRSSLKNLLNPVQVPAPTQCTQSPPLDPSQDIGQFQALNSPLFSPYLQDAILEAEDSDRNSDSGDGVESVDVRMELLTQQDDSSHLQRLGPGARVQPPARTNRKLTNPERATQALAREAKKTKRGALMAALDSAMLDHSNRLSEIGSQHGYSLSYITNLINHSSHFKPKREPTLHNVIQHVMADKLAKAGIKIKGPQDLKKRIEESDEFQNPTPEQVHLWREQLNEHRKNSRLGARMDNKSAAIDYQATMKRMHEEAMELQARTGACVVAIAAPSNISDTFPPAWFATENAGSFVHETLKMTVWDLCRMLGQWACVRKPSVLSVGEMQRECTSLITKGLQDITGKETISMNYVNYDTRIVLKLGVKLEGWTYSEIVTPLAIDDLGDIRTLLEALRSNYCRWIKLTDDKLRRYKRALEAREAQGEQVGRKRKVRSDKGTVRGPMSKKTTTVSQDRDNNTDNAGTSRTSANVARGRSRTGKESRRGGRRAKSSVAAQLPPNPTTQPRSRSVLSDTDLEDFE